MAATPERQIEALISRISASRAVVGRDVEALRRRLDVPSRVKDSFLSKPLAWFGGSLGAGFVASLLLKRRRPRPVPAKTVRRSLWSLALGGAFTLARPALQSWAMEQVRRRLTTAGAYKRHGD